MHLVDITLEGITKVEGSASLSVRVRDGVVEYVKFAITEYKRFFTQAMRGKPVLALPQHLARICGTCSNAHLVCSLITCEAALGIEPSPQTQLLRRLTLNGLAIRDHGLHLYLFALPDIFGKDAFLDFDESDPLQHQLLHDGFEVKAAGNFLSSSIAGRSVHAMYPTIGGYLHFPSPDDVQQAIAKLEGARPAVLRLVDVFAKASFHLNREKNYMALIPDKGYGFIGGSIHGNTGEVISPGQYRQHLEHTVIPYSQASGYRYRGQSYMVGSLARLNLASDRLHQRSRESLGAVLKLFPSKDVYHNNLAQAIETLHCIDESIELLKAETIRPEPLVAWKAREAVGVGVIEAPRGTLYHKIELGADGVIAGGEIVVPTGQNQITIESDLGELVTELVKKETPKDIIAFELEKLIRAYDPCMSCASHFLTVNWQEA